MHHRMAIQLVDALDLLGAKEATVLLVILLADG